MIENIKSPQDIKRLTIEQKEILCAEIRNTLIETVKHTGGHLASSLGTVELTVALHTVFTTPCDKIVWDVGHQAYTHKILTGRLNKLDTLRQTDGLSGFPKPSESKHDAFIAGHSSNSISAAHGIATAMRLKGDDHSVVAVIGDGAMTGGMAYEGMNNAGRSDENLIIILNQNNMSISKNVGALAKYLTTIRTNEKYHDTKSVVKDKLNKAPVIGKAVSKVIHGTKEIVKTTLYGKTTLFEDLGFEYYGPIDGHDLRKLISVLQMAKSLKKPVLIHIETIKGKGLLKAEENPGLYHGMPKGVTEDYNDSVSEQENYSNVFGKTLTSLADKDDKICAITAAMKYGTGLQYFNARHKKRFFDVGIAEEHAVTFAAGLATQGYVPVFAVYSSFLQRAYDQIIHDCAIENTHIVLAVDRAGIVGEDGATHQGLFDVALLSSVPNTTIFSPSTYDELKWCVNEAIYNCKGIAAVRYPRGTQGIEDVYSCANGQKFYHINNYNNTLVVSYGRMFNTVQTALKEEKVDLLKLLQIHPFIDETIEIASKYKKIIFFEEGMKNGGIAQKFECAIREKGYKGDFVIKAIDDEFIDHASVDVALNRCGLDKESVLELVRKEQI